MSRLDLAVRWLGPVSVVLTALFLDAVGASVMMLVCLAITITWRVRLPAALEITTDLTVLVAAWSPVFLLHEKYAHWDLVVHFAATAMLAVLAFRALERWFRLTPPARCLTWSWSAPRARRRPCCAGISSSSATTSLSPEVNVGYCDTMGDLAVGHAGAVVAGILGTWARQRVEASGGARPDQDGAGRPNGAGGPRATDDPDTAHDPHTTETKD